MAAPTGYDGNGVQASVLSQGVGDHLQGLPQATTKGTGRGQGTKGKVRARGVQTCKPESEGGKRDPPQQQQQQQQQPQQQQPQQQQPQPPEPPPTQGSLSLSLPLPLSSLSLFLSLTSAKARTQNAVMPVSSLDQRDSCSAICTPHAEAVQGARPEGPQQERVAS